MASEGEDIPAELDSMLREDADVMLRQVSSPDFRRRVGGWINKHELGMTEGTSNMARELVKDMVRSMQRAPGLGGPGAVRRDLRKLSHLIHDASRDRDRHRAAIGKDKVPSRVLDASADAALMRTIQGQVQQDGDPQRQPIGSDRHSTCH